MKQKYELLAPAGSFPMLVAAVNAGADAVYFGLQKGFGMRANAKNFKISDLPKMREICNKGLDGRKVKMYVTLNTIIYPEEIKEIEKTIKAIKGKVDAVICWDLAVIQLCKKYKVPFFISTQASVSNQDSANFYKKLGAKRIVLARELDLKQIKKISKESKIEIEAFVHGAMCVSVSGRCFMSQFLFNRSANRGACIHPCRRSFNATSSKQSTDIAHSQVNIRDKQEGFELELENNKVMSAKDLCMLPYIEEMKKAGIMGYKIEGRNRDPRYVDIVVRIYRKALDKKLTKQEIKQGMQELEKVYNRKFSSGFYLGKPTPKDFTDIEHSAAKEKKHFIGKVTHYYDKLNVATIQLVSELKVGDKICIIGKTTGIINTKVNSIERKNKSVSKAKKGDEIGIKVPEKIRKNDEVYVILKS